MINATSVLNVERNVEIDPLFLSNIMESNALQLVEATSLSPQARMEMFLLSLPALNKDSSDIALEDSCPICLIPFTSIFAEDCNAEPEMAGVTKLMGCGHIFCRRE